MKSDKIINNALSNLIKERIVEDLVLGKIKSGEKLVEAKYAEEFGTSRAPIREAFYLLTLEGFVQKIPRKGTVVKGYTPAEIRDLLEIRNFLEELALQRLFEKDRSKLTGRMETIIGKMERASHDVKEYAALNYDFHFQMILASESDVIKSMYERLGTPLRSYQTVSFLEEQNIKKSLEEHKRIVQLLKDGSLQEASQLLAKHNKDVFTRIEKYVNPT
ncbi:GntR family transcriptional regulator [Brevibacillus fluminis]|uniref:GntR family transcriptional regulator n=1 Tax=Brevibacillus fluminis TaxID=511487 RepID=A0A3M8DFS1_9BACL|nr:GntR family transcriptional regulator [Brevibacillus fluminis]RNB86952.1 GntR family transcriptional regulator [Brevibacillus fluminis]